MTLRKLVVEVVEAQDFLPKDGQGTSSPYVVMHYHGQRKRTQTAIRDLNSRWNELVEFNVNWAAPEIFRDMLELDVFHDRSYGQTRRNVFLGRIRLSPSQFVRKGEEALIYYGSEKKSLFVWVRGEIGLKIYYVNEAIPLPPPPMFPRSRKLSPLLKMHKCSQKRGRQLHRILNNRLCFRMQYLHRPLLESMGRE